MFKKIQRNIDQKFLLSLDENIWVDNINESKMFNVKSLLTVAKSGQSLFVVNICRTDGSNLRKDISIFIIYSLKLLN